MYKFGVILVLIFLHHKWSILITIWDLNCFLKDHIGEPHTQNKCFTTIVFVAKVILPQKSNYAIITDCDCYKDPSCSKQQRFRSETAEQLNAKDRSTKQASNLGPETTFLLIAATRQMITPKEKKGKMGLNAKDSVQWTRTKSAVKHQWVTCKLWIKKWCNK